jgi:replicative DNA helicase
MNTQEQQPLHIHQRGNEASPFAFVCFSEGDAITLEKAGAERVVQLDNVHEATLQDLAGLKIKEAAFMPKGDDDKAERARAYLEAGGTLCEVVPIPANYENITQIGAFEGQSLKTILQDIREILDTRREKSREDVKQEYANTTTGAKVVDFLQGITSGAQTAFIPTGHKELDKALNGGLYPCFYVIGGISSIGKTAFVMQIADQIAAAGNDILIFSLEMSEGELMARSISRHTFERVKGFPKENKAKTEQQITTRAFWDKYDAEELDLIKTAALDYQKYATDHIHIFEGVGNITAADIKQKVLEHIDLTGNKPLVIIDYLQIIQGDDPRATDKQNTDKNVLEIKRLTRDLCLPVVAISSFNRESYAEPVTMASFKESGAIEYSSDCLIGLQYLGMDYDPHGGKNGQPENKNEHIARVRQLLDEQSEKGKNGQAQNIQAKVLKNRKGYKENCIKFSYYPRYSYFENPANPDKEGFIPRVNAGANRVSI